MHPQRLPALDDPWGRLPLLVPAALLTWALLLFGFSLVLMQSAAPAPELKPVEARIVEIPVGGLQGGAGSETQAAKAPPAVARPAAAPKPKAIHHVAPKPIAPPLPSSPEGTIKSREAAAPAATGGESPAGATGAAGSGGASGEEAGGAGIGFGAGIGSDISGARAVYAPVPKIPDELREDAFEAVAVAQFKVSYDGDVEVTLVKPTSNPRLNQVLLETLKQWKFFPAMKQGIAIDSRFDVRIPISVQ